MRLKGSAQSVIALKKDERCISPSLHEKNVNYYEVVNELDCCGIVQIVEQTHRRLRWLVLK